jgi:putative tryptophan/tyrosine transport system substrate-binding protein
MQFDRLRRRDFIALLGGAVAWPFAAGAQQAATPVIGFLHSQSLDTYRDRMRGFHRGLKDGGYVEGDNLTIVYRFAENQIDRLPTLAAELVRRQVAVIAAAGGHEVALAAKAATATVPIVFTINEDPVRLGLVKSLARPGGNMTGINFFAAELTAKRLEFLRELVPGVARVTVLINPTSPVSESVGRDIEPAARALGLQVRFVRASSGGEINAAFAGFARERPDALFIAPDGFFTSRRVQLAILAARHAVPLVAASREFAEAGGLMSYGSNIADAYRQVGVYTGRILNGAKPSDLPVVQSSKFELVINAETARTLGLTVPPTLLAIADEVIE